MMIIKISVKFKSEGQIWTANILEFKLDSTIKYRCVYFFSI